MISVVVWIFLVVGWEGWRHNGISVADAFSVAPFLKSYPSQSGGEIGKNELKASTVFWQESEREEIIAKLLQEPGDLSTHVWELIKKEGKEMSHEDDFRSSSFVASSLLMENSLDEALIDFIANQLETSLIPATQVRNIFYDVLNKNLSISNAWVTDLVASALHDSSATNFASILLFNKGYHALVAYRIANSLWQSGRDSLARYFQSLISRKFCADLHPASCIGLGCYFAEGSDLVIGETASVGRDCVFQHGVTLGGTGKEAGDRHPKVADAVVIGTGATILGNIVIGEGSMIQASSVVTKSIDPFTVVGGVPAKHLATVEKDSSITLSRLRQNKLPVKQTLIENII